MSRKNRPTGECHICGKHGRLSFEHIPPRAAFNDRQVVSVPSKKLIHLGPDEYPKGPFQQGGAGKYTLCEECNNNTGHWYGKDFADWCYQGMEYLDKTSGKPTLLYLYDLFPLRIIKQIITMFFSINSPVFRAKCPELVKFVLNREKKYLPPQYRIFIYYNISNKYRYVGVSGVLDVEKRKTTTLSEINFPPFGYVLTLDSDPPDTRLAEISFFANYSYDEFKVFSISMPVLDTHLAYPGDYRTKEEILEQTRK